MKGKRRYISLLLTAIMLAVLLQFASAATEEGQSASWQCPEIRKDETGNWDYGVLEDGTAVITGFLIENALLKIPAEIDGFPVTMVARAPQERPDYAKIRSVKKVTLPNSLKVIGQQAFESFSAMTTVNIPQGVETIGNAAFRDCRALKSIDIPNSVTSIGDEAFSQCSSLGFPKLPSVLNSIGRRGFYQCRKISNVKIPASVKSVGDYAFAYCPVKTLSLEEGLEEIGEGAFLENELREIILPSTLKSVGNIAFHPDTIKTPKNVIFNSVSTKIGIGVFGYDNGWIRFYKKLQNGGTDLKKEDYDQNDPANWIDYYRDQDNFGQGKMTVTCYPGSTADQLYQYHVTKKFLKGGTENILTASNDHVFRAGQYTNDDRVYELVIPEGVEELEDNAFAGLETLNKITLPASLTRIGAHAFDGCISLKEIVVQAKSMTEIGAAAFMGCSELTSITIPEGIAEIAGSTFEQCRKLKKVNMPKTGLLRIGDRAFADCAELTDIKLDKGLESIGTEAFMGCGIKSLQIPDSVVSVGKRAFFQSGLTSLVLQKELEEIPDYLCAFSTKLERVTLPKSLKRIGDGAFMRCLISSIKLPEGLESIGEKAFASDASAVDSLYGKKKTLTKLKALTFPGTLKTIGKEAFLANDALSAISFTKNAQLEEIGEGAFACCFRLRGISLPDSMRMIGNEAFLKCKEMTVVDLGRGITELGDDVFNRCSRMIRLIVPDTLQNIGKNVLKEHGSKLTVTTPEGSAFHEYMKENYPRIQVVHPKKK